MSYYPTMPTPPSSNEDSSPSYFVASPNSNTFSPPTNFSVNYGANHGYFEPQMDISEPFLEFIEPPVERFRFRYRSEMAGTHGSLGGVSLGKSRKQTYPTVKLKNCSERAVIRCSIYQIDCRFDELKPHAHRLVRKHGKEEIDDPHDVEVSHDNDFIAGFHSLGIIHTAKKQVEKELFEKKLKLKRELVAQKEGAFRDLTLAEENELKMAAEEEKKTINLNIVCLRFDAFIRMDNGVLQPIARPLFSSGINNLKSALTGDLKIVRMDHCSSPAQGNREIFLFVERVTKKNIKIRLFELDDNEDEVWEAYGKFTDLDVHHQYAIAFKTPPYRDLELKHEVKVFIELLRPSDSSRSERREFKYTPTSDRYRPGNKRSRPSYGSSSFESEGSGQIPTTITQLQNATTINSSELEKIIGDLNPGDFDGFIKNFDAGSLEIDGPSLRVKTKFPEGELGQAFRYIHEFSIFLKTKPVKQRILQKIAKEYKDIVKFVTILLDEEQVNLVCYLLGILNMCGKAELNNQKNFNGNTLLHLALMQKNWKLVRILRQSFQVNHELFNNSSNTPLHLALARETPRDLITLLISPQVINSTNCEGYTPLVLAIIENNLEAVQLLTQSGADVNQRHASNGYSPLRYAIQTSNTEIVKFLFEQPKIDKYQLDFAGINVFQAAIIEALPELSDVVQEYADSSIRTELKEEPCVESDEEMEQVEYKEPLNLKELYRKVKQFTPVCLDKISQILDANRQWEKLADLMDLKDCITGNYFSPETSMSKQLLKFAVEYTEEPDVILQIRNFLHDLDQKEIVQLMDDMALLYE